MIPPFAFSLRPFSDGRERMNPRGLSGLEKNKFHLEKESFYISENKIGTCNGLRWAVSLKSTFFLSVDFCSMNRSDRVDPSFFCWAQKKDARKGPGNR